jgi:uncharacterized protein YecE (DUF72 family)
MKLYVGTSGFGYKAWKGKFYPKDLPEKNMLDFYGKQFQAVEINNTFYRMPTPSLFESWSKEVSVNFKFAIKAPRIITHNLQLKDAAGALAQFSGAADTLGSLLGPLFFQLPPFLKKDLGRLREFLALRGSPYRWAFEFRHPSWHDSPVFDLLAEHQTALCIAETDEGQTPFVSTADWGYLRLRRSLYRDPDLKEWLQRVQKQEWKHAFIFFKHEDEAKGPIAARKFIEMGI